MAGILICAALEAHEDGEAIHRLVLAGLFVGAVVRGKGLSVNDDLISVIKGLVQGAVKSITRKHKSPNGQESESRPLEMTLGENRLMSYRLSCPARFAGAWADPLGWLSLADYPARSCLTQTTTFLTVPYPHSPRRRSRFLFFKSSHVAIDVTT